MVAHLTLDQAIKVRILVSQSKDSKGFSNPSSLFFQLACADTADLIVCGCSSRRNWLM